MEKGVRKAELINTGEVTGTPCDILMNERPRASNQLGRDPSQ